MDKAASSISDADLVDALIHGFVSCIFNTWMTNRPTCPCFQTGATLEFDAAARCVLDCATCFLLVWQWHGLRWSQPDDLSAVRLWSKVKTLFIAHTETIPSRWLGQNSKQGKLHRQLGEVQIHMRLKVSGDKTEIRQSYLPGLFPCIVKPLVDDGSVGYSLFSSDVLISIRFRLLNVVGGR